jgi:UDP:flavonoid glycosyltransferase YjiC (YdhE family)
VTTHWDHLETEFAFRTRVVDYLWCGLPVVSTAGDELADLLERSGAGSVVPAGDVEALRAALVRMATSASVRDAAGRSARQLADSLSWERVCRPLADFCAAPHRAPDLVLDPVDRLQLGLRATATSSGSLLQRCRAALREGGPGLLARRLAARVPVVRRSARPGGRPHR